MSRARSHWPEVKEAAKDRVQSYSPCGRFRDEFLSPTLSAALDWLPPGGRDGLALDIRDAVDDEALFDVFDNFVTAVVLPFKAITKVPIVKESPHPKRRSSADAVLAKLPDSERRHKDWSDECLERDGYHCAITGALDTTVWELQGSPEDTFNGDLEVHHIVPFSLAYYTAEEATEAAIKWEGIYRCFPSIRKIFRVSTINDHDNGITLHERMHKQFHLFRCALQPTETPDVYKVKLYRKFDFLLKPHAAHDMSVTLKQARGHTEKLPNRELLDCHYRICGVFHASGMGEAIDYHYHHWKEMKKQTAGLAVAPDGSTDLSSFLRSAFWAVGLCA